MMSPRKQITPNRAEAMPEEKITITANGEKTVAAPPKTVAQFATERGLNPRRCLVELNGKAMRFSQFENAELKDGDVLEIMSLVAGG